MNYIFLFIIPFARNIINILNDINYEYRLYPRWIKRKNGSLIECKTDEDCLFPTACCNHPFIPFEYCCNGWNRREMKYAYNYNYIKK